MAIFLKMIRSVVIFAAFVLHAKSYNFLWFVQDSSSVTVKGGLFSVDRSVIVGDVDGLCHGVLSLRLLRRVLDDYYSIDFGGSGSAANIGFLRVLSFPLFLVGMFRRSVSARRLGDGALFRFFSS